MWTVKTLCVANEPGEKTSIKNKNKKKLNQFSLLLWFDDIHLKKAGLCFKYCEKWAYLYFTHTFATEWQKHVYTHTHTHAP